MPVIYKYQKISDAYTTYILAEPDYELLGLGEESLNSAPLTE